MNKRKKLINEIANRIVGRILTEGTTKDDIMSFLSNVHSVQKDNPTDIVNYTGMVLKEPTDVRGESPKQVSLIIASSITYAILNVVPTPGVIQDEVYYVYHPGRDDKSGLHVVPSSDRVRLANRIEEEMVRPFVLDLFKRVDELLLQGANIRNAGENLNINLGILEQANKVRTSIVNVLEEFLKPYPKINFNAFYNIQ